MTFSRSQKNKRTKFPLATVMPYGPDDKTVTKIAVGIMAEPNASDVAAMERWVGTNVASDEKVAREMYNFMRAHRVKTVTTATVVMGCPHEEGEDFPDGQDCPFCPFWKGLQGKASHGDPRWDNLKYLRVEKLETGYRFWLP